MKIEIYLEGMSSQRQSVNVIHVKGGVIETRTEGGIKGRFRLKDGLACDGDGEPSAWQFWRVDMESLSKLTAHEG